MAIVSAKINNRRKPFDLQEKKALEGWNETRFSRGQTFPY